MPSEDLLGFLPGKAGCKADGVFLWPAYLGNRRCLNGKFVPSLREQFAPPRRRRGKDKGHAVKTQPG